MITILLAVVSITSLLMLVLVALVLFLCWFFIGKMMEGTAHQIVGAILAIIFLIYALHTFGIF